MATMTSIYTTFELRQDDHDLHLMAPAFSWLEQLQSRHRPSIIPMSLAPAVCERGRAFQRRRARPSKAQRASRTQSPKLLAERLVVRGLTTYPPYIPVPDVRHNNSGYSGVVELVEGAMCKLVLQLVGEGKPSTEIIDHLWRTHLESDQRPRFSACDVRALVAHCRPLGLTPYTALESEDWDPEEYEKWWIKEDRRRWDSPVGKDICGSSGWWNKLESRRNRDWVRWPSPEIGQRKEVVFNEEF